MSDTARQREILARAILGVSVAQAQAELDSGEIGGTPAGEAFRVAMAALDQVDRLEAELGNLRDELDFAAEAEERLRARVEALTAERDSAQDACWQVVDDAREGTSISRGAVEMCRPHAEAAETREAGGVST